MTVTATRESRKVVVNDGSFANPIDFNQLIENATDIKVYADTTLLSVGTHYTVSGVGDSAGIEVTITATGLALDPDDWVILHDPLMDQNADLGAGGGFGLPYENALDALTRRVQVLADRVRRSVQMHVNEIEDAPLIVPGDRTEGTTLVFDEDGNLREGADQGEIENAAEHAADAAATLLEVQQIQADLELLAENLNAAVESITPQKLLFEGDGVTTEFLLGQSVGEVSLDVYVSGVWQNSDTWSIVGGGGDTTLTFSVAPPASVTPGDKNIEVKLGAQASVASAVVAPNTVGTSQLQNEAVTNDKVEAGSLALDRLAATVQTIINTANQRAAKHYGNKATAEAATIDAATLYTRIRGRANPGDGGEAVYRRLGAAAIASGYPGFTSADGANWQFVPTDWKVRPEHFGAVGDGVTDDYAALQAAVDFIYDRGGGIVELGWDKKYGVSQTVFLWQRVRLVGVGGYWLNQYAVGGGTPLGSTIFTLAGADCDAVQARMRLFNDGGTLKEVGFSRTNTDFRHHGGSHRVMYWGNRANNAAGCGFSVYGCRYVYVEQNAALECSEHGFEFIARNYTADLGVGGLIGSNNQRVFQNAGHNNDMSGFLIAMHDSLVCMNDAGNNLEDGFTGYFGQTCNDNAAWNNIERGFNLGTDAGYATTNATSATFSGNNAYDNELDGFMFSGNVAPVANGCYARANGRNTGAAITNRCNFKITSTVRGGGFVGCQSQAWDYDGVTPITYYGFLVSNPTYKIQFAGNHDRGSTVPKSVSTPANLIAPEDVS